ncbi:type IV toxin-antitoxin system AbiEi family antitoxin domain-containing protein [Streptomyces goshikiensis]|uniref:type IV toxin-antitoxin system AbiEi family antitoxin domain-containing protein n=1 Tax=Streptomyces goshikiensis TaxID=1942 RepID=UPI00367F040E
MERSESVRRLSEIAVDQWGLVTARQAQAAGLSRVDLGRLIDAELLLRAAHGVYQMPGGAPTPHVDVKAAWLRLDPATAAWKRQLGDSRSGVVSRASACQLHDIGDIPADDVELSVPVRRTTRENGVVLHRDAVPAEDVTVIDGLPVTTVDRTICDLLRSRADGGHVGRVLADADQRGLTDTRRLAARVQPYARAYGLPAKSTGSELLNFLAEQAGFTLRDEQLTAAGERAAITSAIYPEAVLEVLRSRQPAATGMADAVRVASAALEARYPARAVRGSAATAAQAAYAATAAHYQSRAGTGLAAAASAIYQARQEAVARAMENLAPKQAYLQVLQQQLSAAAMAAQPTRLSEALDSIRRLWADLPDTRLPAAQIAALQEATGTADRMARLTAELPKLDDFQDALAAMREISGATGTATAARPAKQEAELKDDHPADYPESGSTNP